MSKDHDDAVAREQQAQIDDGLTADGAMDIVRRRTASPEKQRAIAGSYTGFADDVKERLREQNAGSQLSDRHASRSTITMEPSPGGDLPDPRTFWLGE